MRGASQHLHHHHHQHLHLSKSYGMSRALHVLMQLLYMTFLAEFFLDDELNMDLLYYSEMKDAGYFEDGAEMY